MCLLPKMGHYLRDLSSGCEGEGHVFVDSFELVSVTSTVISLSGSRSINFRLWNFGIGYATPYMVDVGPGKAGLKTNVFWIWGGFCVLCVVFSYFVGIPVPSRHPYAGAETPAQPLR
jgi:hypothetical protein